MCGDFLKKINPLSPLVSPLEAHSYVFCGTSQSSCFTKYPITKASMNWALHSEVVVQKVYVSLFIYSVKTRINRQQKQAHLFDEILLMNNKTSCHVWKCKCQSWDDYW